MDIYENGGGPMRKRKPTSMQIESVLGAAGGILLQTKEAVANLNWTKTELDVIMEQWSWVIGIPKCPAAATCGRYLGFASSNFIVDYESA